jgi:hypothetical protein
MFRKFLDDFQVEKFLVMVSSSVVTASLASLREEETFNN